jgi:hypothetical protein
MKNKENHRSQVSLMRTTKSKEKLQEKTPYTKVYILGSSDLLGFAGKDPMIKLAKLCSYNILIK